MNQKKVLITGVLGGIGSALAHAFREAGYYVYGLDLRASEDYHSDQFIQFDLHQFAIDPVYRIEWKRKFNVLVPELDVLVNNAAVQLLDGLDELRLDDWNHTLAVNLTGPLLLSQHFLDALEEVHGCIINIGSIHQQLTKRRFICYATSKSALIGLTKAMAVDL